MPTYTEQRFEDHIEHHLNQSGYRSLQSADYDKSLCLIPDEVLQFIQDTQPKEYQTDFTPEDKVDLDTIHKKNHENAELRRVIEGDNSGDNKRYKFEQVIDEILLGFVNSKLELYTKLSQPEINAAFKRHLYRDYLQQ